MKRHLLLAVLLQVAAVGMTYAVMYAKYAHLAKTSPKGYEIIYQNLPPGYLATFWAGGVALGAPFVLLSAYGAAKWWQARVARKERSA